MDSGSAKDFQGDGAIAVNQDSGPAETVTAIQPTTTLSTSSSSSNDDKMELESNPIPSAKLGCGVMARYPVTSIVTCATLGIITGYCLTLWEPENPQGKDDLVRWIGLVGDMFLRGLKCVVLPLVFVNVSLATADMLGLGKARKVGTSTVGLYMFTTLLAACIGISSVTMYQSLFLVNIPEDNAQSRFEILCDEDSYMTELPNKTLACVKKADANDSTLSESQQFIINDMDNTFVHTSSGPQDDISLADTIYEGVFVKLISDNIIKSFYEANFGAVIVAAVFFGVAIYKATQGLDRVSTIISLFKELENALIRVINWILTLTPFAVFSLIANGVGKQDDLAQALTNVGYLICAAITGFLLHFLVVYMGLYLIITKENPLKYLRHLIPAQTMAFASSSSAATIPVTLKCALDSNMVSPLVAKFVVPLGSTINMDGTAVYMTICIIFLAVTSGIEDQINAASYLLLIVISTIGSAGTAPVPSASLVLIITGYNTVFNTTGTPPAFSFILAIDWLLDRCRTVLNVSGDAIVARLVSHIASKEQIDEDEACTAGVGEAAVRIPASESITEDSNNLGTNLHPVPSVV